MIELKIGERLMSKLDLYEVKRTYEHGDADGETTETSRFGTDDDQLRQLHNTVYVLMAMNSASYNDRLPYLRNRDDRFKALLELCPDVSDGVVADVMDGYEQHDIIYEGSGRPAHLVDIDIVYYNDRGEVFEVDIIAKD